MASLTAMTSYPQSTKLEGKKKEIKSTTGGQDSAEINRMQRNKATNYTLSSNRDYVIMKASTEQTLQQKVLRMRNTSSKRLLDLGKTQKERPTMETAKKLYNYARREAEK